MTANSLLEIRFFNPASLTETVARISSASRLPTAEMESATQLDSSVMPLSCAESAPRPVLPEFLGAATTCKDCRRAYDVYCFMHDIVRAFRHPLPKVSNP